MKIQLDPESNARHSILMIRRWWNVRPWKTTAPRHIIRDHIRIVRAAYPKHPPCEPVPYSLPLVSTMPKPPNLLDELDRHQPTEPWSVKQRKAFHEWNRRRTSFQNHLRDVWSGKLPQMRWNGTGWEEVGE